MSTKLKVVAALLLLSGCGSYFKGQQGLQGATGVSGEVGATGSSCTISLLRPNDIAPMGGALVTCGSTSVIIQNGADGSNGINGTNGNNGATGSTGATGDQGQPGPQGIQGIAGAPGTNATPVTMLQFCAGYTPTYPSVFPEDGLCLNGVVYAIYDQANGYDYLSEIPPGRYESSTTGASCSFTVSSNCVVSP